MEGEQIRRARQRFGYTLKDLSRKTHLSVGYLSNIERNVTSPTVDTLEIICNALRMDIVDVLRGGKTSPLMKSSERACIYADHDGVLENCASPESIYRCTCYTMAEGFQENVVIRSWDGGDILCYQLSGRTEMNLDGEKYIMEPGDTIVIPAHHPHSFRQLGEETNRTLWFYKNVRE